jgi:hypothetical protein
MPYLLDTNAARVPTALTTPPHVALALLAAIEDLQLEAETLVLRDHAAKLLPEDGLAVDNQQQPVIEGIRITGDLPADHAGVGDPVARSLRLDVLAAKLAPNALEELLERDE